MRVVRGGQARLPDLADFVDQLRQRLVLVADHVGVGFKLALRVHQCGQLGGGVDVGALERLALECDVGGGGEFLVLAYL